MVNDTVARARAPHAHAHYASRPASVCVAPAAGFQDCQACFFLLLTMTFLTAQHARSLAARSLLLRARGMRHGSIRMEHLKPGSGAHAPASSILFSPPGGQP